MPRTFGIRHVAAAAISAMLFLLAFDARISCGRPERDTFMLLCRNYSCDDTYVEAQQITIDKPVQIRQDCCNGLQIQVTDIIKILDDL